LNPGKMIEGLKNRSGSWFDEKINGKHIFYRKIVPELTKNVI
jgi:hypothetical protein